MHDCCESKHKESKLSDFYTETIRTWDDFIRLRAQFGDDWVFRGQPQDRQLKTSFERACDRFGINPEDRPQIESELVTDFRRRYDGSDRQFVISDTLYCLALMQHHGAPTRLLDWTYSPFVAVYFALEAAEGTSVLWCLSQKWCTESACAITGKQTIDLRSNRNTRDDNSFLPLYMGSAPKKLINLENPFFFNHRLNIQQGLFLCPGDIRTSFEDNLKAHARWFSRDAVFKIRCQMTKKNRVSAMKELHRMNIHRESLFPGLDGFAQSMGHRLWLYQLIIQSRESEGN